MSFKNCFLLVLRSYLNSVVKFPNYSIFRGNPLINRFVRELTYSPPSLLELAGRSVVTNNLQNSTHINPPREIISRLQSAKCCPNPECGGVYFDHQYRQVQLAWKNRVGAIAKYYKKSS